MRNKFYLLSPVRAKALLMIPDHEIIVNRLARLVKTDPARMSIIVNLMEERGLFKTEMRGRTKLVKITANGRIFRNRLQELNNIERLFE